MLVLIAAYIGAPFRFKGGAFFDVRFIIMLGYVLFAGLGENPKLPRRGMAIAQICLLVIIGARMGLLSMTWQEQNEDVAQVRKVITLVQPGSRVLVANVTSQDSERYWAYAPAVRRLTGLYMADYHLPALLILEQHAMFQTFFADVSQQPIMIQPSYASSAAPTSEWGPPSYTLLEAGSLALGPSSIFGST